MNSTNLSSYDENFVVSDDRPQTSPTVQAGFFNNTTWAPHTDPLSINHPYGAYPQTDACYFSYDDSDNVVPWQQGQNEDIATSESSTAPRNGIPTPPLSSSQLPPSVTTGAHNIYPMATTMTTPDASTSEQAMMEYPQAVPDSSWTPKQGGSKVSKSKSKGKGKAPLKPRSRSEGEIMAHPYTPSSTSSSRRTLRTANRKKDESNEELSMGASPPITERIPETPQQQEKIARAKHNDVEREYRNRLNLQYRMLIDTLDESGPRMDGRREKDLSKAEVLELARQRISSLSDEIVKSSDENRLLKEQVAGLLSAIQR